MAYQPSEMPKIENTEELRRYVQDEFLRLSQALLATDDVRFAVRHVAPERPTAGMVVFADGTNWNPGSGRGLYEYRVASWVKL